MWRGGHVGRWLGGWRVRREGRWEMGLSFSDAVMRRSTGGEYWEGMAWVVE